MLISNMHVSDVLGIPCSQHRDYNIELYKLVEAKFFTACWWKPHFLLCTPKTSVTTCQNCMILRNSQNMSLCMHMKVGRGNLKWALICPWDRVGS